MRKPNNTEREADVDLSQFYEQLWEFWTSELA